MVIFTDFIDPNQSLDILFEPYKHLKYNKHEVILFYLYESKTEQNLEFENRSYKFIDLESQEEIKINPLNFKKNINNKLIHFLKN